MSAPSVTFRTTLSSFGNNTGIEVPPELIEAFGSGKRPAVVVNVNGYEYRNTVGVMAGKYLVSVSAAVRKATGLNGGDLIDVTLTLAREPRPVEIPDDFRAALDRSPEAAGFFAGLSNSLQRYHVDLVEGAKTPETRDRRIAKPLTSSWPVRSAEQPGPTGRSWTDHPLITIQRHCGARPRVVGPWWTQRSCRSSPSISPSTHTAAMRSPGMVKTAAPVYSNRRPVGGIPNTSPRWVPV